MPAPPYSLRHRDAQQAELRHPAEDAIAVEPVLAVELADVRRDFARAPFADRLLEQPLFVGQVEVIMQRPGIAITRLAATHVHGRRRRGRAEQRRGGAAAVGRDLEVVACCRTSAQISPAGDVGVGATTTGDG